MGMQGWRRTMEDSHIAHINLEPGGNSLFGVFDGHGGGLTLLFNNLTVMYVFLGQEVALYVKKHFAKELIKLASYKSKCYKEALEEVF